MPVCRYRQVQEPLQIHLLRRARQQIDAPHHARHALRGIVYDHRQLVSEGPVVALQDEVPAILREDLLVMPLEKVLELHFHRRHLHANGTRPPRGLSGRPLFRSQVAASSRVDGFLPAMRSACGMQVRPGAVAFVNACLFANALKGLLVGVAAFALVDDVPLPFEAEEVVVSQDRIDVVLAAALGVEVLDSQDDVSAAAAGDYIGDEGGEDVAGVHPARGRRREPPHERRRHRRTVCVPPRVLHAQLIRHPRRLSAPAGRLPNSCRWSSAAPSALSALPSSRR